MLEINKSIMTTKGCYLNANKPKYIVLHYTGCTAPARNFALNQKNNNPKGTAHIFVDETSIYQSLEFNHGAWAVGDNQGYGTALNGVNNRNSISVEMVCMPNGDISSKVESNALELVKYLMDLYNVPVENICRHYDVSKKDCPKGWNNKNSSFGGEGRFRMFINKLSSVSVDEVFERAKNYNSPRCKELQEKLNSCGYDCGKPDNVYGYKTHSALGLFQSKNNLKKDFLAGNATFTKLDQIIELNNKPQEPKYKVKNCVCYCNEVDKRAAQYLADFLGCECIDARISKDWSGYAKNLYGVGGDNPNKDNGEYGFSGYTTKFIKGNNRYETMQSVLNFIKQ